MPIFIDEKPPEDPNRKDPFLASPDTHIAVCVGVWDLGKSLDEKYPDENGKPKIKNKILIGWEVEESVKSDSAEYNGKRKRVDKFYTKSLYKEADLAKTIEGWVGIDSLKNDEGKPDLESLIGEPCMLNVNNYTAKSGKIKAGVIGVSKLLKGVDAFEPDNLYKGVDTEYVKIIREANKKTVEDFEKAWESFKKTEAEDSKKDQELPEKLPKEMEDRK